MRRHQQLLPFFLLTLVLVSLIQIPLSSGCKDIIATTKATGSDYSLLLKVRDPSRPGLQVLTRIPRGTTYTYQYPWTGKPWEFTVNHTFLGVATQGDTLPNIVKAGMLLTDAGLAFGDADTASRWVNPTRNAWDDFDWLRYAAQTADDLPQAVALLTTDAVDTLHATGVGENLFLESPTQAVVIEADAMHHTTTLVDDVWVMSNYPIALWRTQLVNTRLVARAFDTTKESWVWQGCTVRLGSIYGVKILAINDTTVTVVPSPRVIFQLTGQDNPVTIGLGQRATVGPYSVILEEITGHRARLSIQTAAYVWQQEVLAHIEPAVGHISVMDMIAWSRLHKEDLDGLRPLCEDTYPYEAAMIWKVPVEYADQLGAGWFAANHACSSIYVPVHICDDDIYGPYQTGDAAQLSLDLLAKYGHEALVPSCEAAEAVFLGEINLSEAIAQVLIETHGNITGLMTSTDTGLQEQAYLTEQLWLEAPPSTEDLIRAIWNTSYTVSMEHMETTTEKLQILGATTAAATIEDIALSICHTRIAQAIALGIPCMAQQQDYTTAKNLFSEGRTSLGFTVLQSIVRSLPMD